MKVALVHDWLTGMRGGEKVLEVLCELYPEADLYTLIHIKGRLSPVIERMNIITSFLQNLPGAESHYRKYLPIMPIAIATFDLTGYDLVISSSHCVAKNVLRGAGGKHICYCHTPMRYAFDQKKNYFSFAKNGVAYPFIELILFFLKKWDVFTANRVDRFVANSKNVAEKIYRYYELDADVIHPPVDANFYIQPEKQKSDYYLIVSAFAPYKRLDIPVELFNRTGKKLKIVGTGQEFERIKSIAKPNIELLGWADDSALRELYSGAKGLIFPGEEDFGIVPLEAMASGTPVIAYGKGGALETVVPLASRVGAGIAEKPTGILFHEQTIESLGQALEYFEQNLSKFDIITLQEHARKFDREQFKKKMAEYLEKHGGNRG